MVLEHQLLGQEQPSEPDEIAEPFECVVTGWTRCGKVRDPLGRTPHSALRRSSGEGPGARWASFDRPARLLMVNQFAINLGFYMLMPYLADHLAHGLGLAAWTVGLVLGVRNLSQQGMFLIGEPSPTGTAASR